MAREECWCLTMLVCALTGGELVASCGLAVGTNTPRKRSRKESPSSDASSEEGERKRKKARTTFTGRQIFELERQFEMKKYLSSTERAEMAKLLSVTETQVSPLHEVVLSPVDR